jgi:NADH-quinone oxidoreductase subunit C
MNDLPVPAPTPAVPAVIPPLNRAATPAVVSGTVVGRGMFGADDAGDTTGYSGLVRRRAPIVDSPRPYGHGHDEVVDALAAAMPTWRDAVSAVVVDRGELTLHVEREGLRELARVLRDAPTLRYEMSSGVSGVHYPDEPGRELRAVYHLLSMTHNRRLRLEVSAPDADPTIPTLMDVWPTLDWHERETWDFFGIVFTGRDSLTRIEMPDDWPGHPQRKDYPLGGIPVEYKGAVVPAPDQRRSYR